MSFAAIRSLFERELNAEFSAMQPPVTVVFDNVQDTPPGEEFAIVNLSYPSTTEPVLCPDESCIEVIRGSVQVSCYSQRGRGMKRLEQMATVAMRTLNNLQKAYDPDGVRPRIGSIDGPTPILSGDQPQALVTIAAPFTAKG